MEERGREVWDGVIHAVEKQMSERGREMIE
jgi:hypothetical protein